MGWFYRRVIRPVLFAGDPEDMHDRTLRGLALASRSALGLEGISALYGAPSLPVRVMGRWFPNPVGIAAGLDKYCEAVPAWRALGFGFCELGGITARAQPGQAAPRMFRVPEEGALINRMGFNNPGAEAAAERLRAWRESGLWPDHPVGVNLGKSRDVPLEAAAEDYARSYAQLRSLVDFVVLNVSSPNTPGLRDLQSPDGLEPILERLRREEAGFPDVGPVLLVKVSPDLGADGLDAVAALALAGRVDGLVATNTTTRRPLTGRARVNRVYAEAGGLSGRPLRARSTEVVRHLYRATGGRVPLIGVGGIFSAGDAWEKITAGASLIQVYTGLVYEGPGVAGVLVDGLKERLDRSGLASLEEAVGLSERTGAAL